MNQSEELVAAIEDYVARAIAAHLEAFLPKQKETIASLERRLSRNAEHVQRLESRLRAIETRGPSNG